MRSGRPQFSGVDGQRLAPRIDMPDAAIRAHALFAHCFTCRKGIFGACRIARALADHGAAVLRLDFTGLGASEGEFANTDFSPNVADLVAVANHLRHTYRAPQLLIGHSLLNERIPYEGYCRRIGCRVAPHIQCTKGDDTWAT
jgi:alpha/beta superfamily hydrolase